MPRESGGALPEDQTVDSGDSAVEHMTDSQRGGWRAADPASPFFVRHADALYEAVESAIRAGRIDARSEIGDAALDYRQERDEMAQARRRG